MNTTTDIDFPGRQGRGRQDWRKRPQQRGADQLDHAVPGAQRQSEGHQDWDDLVKPGIQVVWSTPRPAATAARPISLHGARCAPRGGTDAQAADFVGKLYRTCRCSRGGRDATGIFLQRNIGDVLVTFEVRGGLGRPRVRRQQTVDAIHPSVSIVAENPVAVVEAHGQEEGHRHRARPIWTTSTATRRRRSRPSMRSARQSEGHPEEVRAQLKPIKLFTVERVFRLAGRRRRRCTSTTAASSTSSTAGKNGGRQEVLPGFQLTLGYTLFPVPDRAGAAVGAAVQDLQPDAGPVLGRGGVAARARVPTG